MPSNLEQHEREQPNLARHEYINGPGPYALPDGPSPYAPVKADESTSEAGHAGRRRAPGPMARTWRTSFAVIMSIILMSAFGVSNVFSSEPRKLLVADTFGNSEASGWGQSDTGLPWLYPTGTDNVSTASGQGVMRLAGRNSPEQVSLNTRVRDVTLEYDFSLDHMTGGSGVQVMAVLRKSPTGSYRVRVRVGREGRVWLSVAKERGPRTATTIGRPVLVKGWRYQAGQTVHVLAQAIKRDPTQLRVKVWPNGSAQPPRWQLVRDDLGSDISGVGRVGIRALITRQSAGTAATLRFDDIRINRAQDATRAPVTRSETPRPGSKDTGGSSPGNSAPEDQTAPKVLDIGVKDVSARTATVTWTLDEPADGFVKYGKSSKYGLETERETSFKYRTHVQEISGLEPETRYHYAIVSKDESGNMVTTKDRSFTTARTFVPAPAPERTPAPTTTPKPTAEPTPQPTDTNPPTISDIGLQDLSTTSVTIAWSLDEPATGQVEYGTSKAYGSTTAREDSFDYTHHAQSVTGLKPSTTYHFRVISVDQAGNVAASDNYAFRTADAPTPTPTPKPTATPQPTPKPTPAPTPTPTPTSAPTGAPESTPPSSDMYGPGISMTSLANTRVGGPSQTDTVSFRFRAEKSGDIRTARIYLQAGSGYGGGDGGRYAISIRPDDGTSSHTPTSEIIASTDVAPGSGSSAGYLIKFDSNAQVTAGRIYHLVVRNTSTSPGTNYMSVNSLYLDDVPSGQWRPRWDNSDWAHLYKSGSSWTLRRGYAPILDLGFADGHHEGNGYIEISYSGSEIGKISGDQMVRQTLTVSGGDRVVTGAGIRLQRVSGNGDLTLRLEASDGKVLASTTIAASAVPGGSSAGLGEDSEWAYANFPSPVTIKKGSTYRLRLSTGSSTVYATWAIREGTSYGYHSDTYFDDGLAQMSTSGGSWSSLGRVTNQNDLQFYLSTK